MATAAVELLLTLKLMERRGVGFIIKPMILFQKRQAYLIKGATRGNICNRYILSDQHLSDRLPPFSSAALLLLDLFFFLQLPLSFICHLGFDLTEDRFFSTRKEVVKLGAYHWGANTQLELFRSRTDSCRTDLHCAFGSRLL